MEFLELAKSRYTTKKYNANKKIEKEKIQQLKEILRLSPSSINSQPWRFIFVSDEKTKKELACVSLFNEEKINDASHLVVFNVVDNIDLFEEQIHQHLPEGAVGYYTHFLKTKPEAEIKAWLKNQVYLSLGFFLSTCAGLEIDSTPIEGLENEKYDAILKQDGYKTLFAVAIGYRDSEDANQPSLNPKSRLPLESVIKSI